METHDREKLAEYGKLYQDQLYGAKVLTPLAVSIIDTPEFQRLAGMRQLGFASLVYRGATHTRFTHSIGTYFLTRTILRRIVQNHERLCLEHPGEYLPDCYSLVPQNAYEKDSPTTLPVTCQSKWRGLIEVVSIAALMHDLSHVPFGHTLEDEFAGIFPRHDSLGGLRLHTLLFAKESKIRALFSKSRVDWIRNPLSKTNIANEKLLQLIYLMLSWKEVIDPPRGFASILQMQLDGLGKELKDKRDRTVKDEETVRRLAFETRLNDLKSSYEEFSAGDRPTFQPFMSDVVGNTICADLLDYLPRDRMNLGMEYRRHDRLCRYLTIREGCLYQGEGKRVSIMVTRLHRGGQRRDVATAVLDIMRERYEMAERVFYHHKKAAASAMLAKLAEIATNQLDEHGEIYPGPWENGGSRTHPLHFDDDSFIDMLGMSPVDEEHTKLQRDLYSGLRFDRSKLYRTLLVVDADTVEMSARSASYFAIELRGNEPDEPSNKRRIALEKELAKAAEVAYGEVLVYCPSPNMQAKEVDARLEIKLNRILPLRTQAELFHYHADVEVLKQYYKRLWQIYVFVSPDLFNNAEACKRMVDAFCQHFRIEPILAYSKVRRYEFNLGYDVVASRALEPVANFFRGNSADGLRWSDTPAAIIAGVVSAAALDKPYLLLVNAEASEKRRIARLAQLYDVVILQESRAALPAKSKQGTTVDIHIRALIAGELDSLYSLEAARMDFLAAAGGFEAYKTRLCDHALK